MKIELYIGTTLIDFDEEINVNFAVGDIRDLSLGNLNKSYNITLPLTDTNKSAIKHSHIPGSTDEVTDTGRIYVNGLQIIYGVVKVLGFSEDRIKISITADDWIDDLMNTDLMDVDFSAEDHALTNANIVASWSAANAFYRYPMINFGQLVTPATGIQPHDFSFNDFIPMFRVIDLLEYIFSPWIIVSDWFDSTYAKAMYMLGVERKLSSDFIEEKDLEVYVNSNSDNQEQQNYSASETSEINLSPAAVNFTTETTDEGNDFNAGTDIYTVPEDGTYRFITKLTAAYVSGLSGFTCNSSEFTVSIKKNGTGTIISDTEIDAASDGAFTSITLDTGYVHLEAGDTVQVECLLSADFTNGGTPDYMRIYLVAGSTTSYFKNSWDEWNRYPGLNKNITAADYMPDIKCVDFVKAVKHVANLRFFVDRSNHKIYIEPAQTFFSPTNEMDLTSVQDFEEIGIETISRNYRKNILLGFKEDLSDKAYKEYLEYNEPPDRKTITLSSVYTEPGEQEMISPLFAHSVMGYFPEIREWDSEVLRIYGDQEYVDTKNYPPYRAAGFEPRLVKWEGLTSGISFDFGGSTYSQYAKVTPVDFSDLYDNYWLTTIHQIDKNVIVTLRVKLPQQVLNQLTMVLDDSEEEGFRPKYKIKVRGQYVYGYLNNVVTDGDVSECEFIIKN